MCGDRIGFVVIGKNEGERLKRCLGSVPADQPVIYVDSGSTDGSIEWAKLHGCDVIVLNAELPFTAARARNAGFARLKAIRPNIEFVHFVDGDCELAPEWPFRAIDFLDANKLVCSVFGRRRERFPERSIYNYLCDVEWNVPPGESRSFGGDVLIRVNALEQAGGYRNDLIAGEEPELCVRLRGAGWKIWRLDSEMTRHDAAIMRFSQWWRRSVRSGYAFAQGAKIHGALPEKHWVWESRRAIVWGAVLPVLCVTFSLVFPPWGNLFWCVFPLQLLRRSWKISGTARHRTTLASFEILARFPEMVGQLKFLADEVFHRQRNLIEYK